MEIFINRIKDWFKNPEYDLSQEWREREREGDPEQREEIY